MSKQSISPNTSKNNNTDLNKGTKQEGNMLLCSTQDVWTLLTSMQSTLMKQAEDIKNLALQNQELEHKINIQNIQAMHQEKQIQGN